MSDIAMQKVTIENGEEDVEISSYSIGPFTIDVKTKRVTMGAGVYTLSRPLVFTIDEDTKIEGVACVPLDDVDANSHALNYIATVGI